MTTRNEDMLVFYDGNLVYSVLRSSPIEHLCLRLLSRGLGLLKRWLEIIKLRLDNIENVCSISIGALCMAVLREWLPAH